MKVLGSLLASLLLLPAVSQARPFDCAALKGATVSASAIGLPTRGARVSAAERMADTTTPGRGYCLISGEIRSVDPAAQDIHFQLALPEAWNGKAAMLGGGGFNGVIPPVVGNVRNMPPGAPTPLARGYAVFANDSGHQAKPSALGPPFEAGSGAFLANPEQYRNYVGDALKKTRDVAMVLIEKATGRQPARSYFFGSSKGGTEALVLAGRWPQDWDGVVALYPGRSFAVALLGQLKVTQALAAPGAYLTPAKRKLLHRAALGACDKLDGLEDGIISNVAGCYAAFDPKVALRCPEGLDAGDACLSDAQLAALKAIGQPLRFGFPAGHEPAFMGFNVLTAGLGDPAGSAMERRVATLTIGQAAATSPPSAGNSASAFFSDRFLGGAFADPAIDPLKLDIANPGPLAARLAALIAIDDVTTDLTAFHDRGGRLIIVQGTDDMLSSPRQIEAYDRQLVETMGAGEVADFLRFYEVPGFGHNSSAVFDMAWDQVGAIEAWVERGADPASRQVVADTSGVPGRTRPLCPYPSWPRYRGHGDRDAAASFDCAAP
jgi:feruloyl esterase